MKATIMMTTAALLIGSASLPALAGSKEQQQLAQCKEQLAGIYGEDARLRLKSMQSGKVRKMRIQAIPAGGESNLVVCWVDSEQRVHLEDRDGVALNLPAYDSSDKVSLSD